MINIEINTIQLIAVIGFIVSMCILIMLLSVPIIKHHNKEKKIECYKLLNIARKNGNVVIKLNGKCYIGNKQK